MKCQVLPAKLDVAVRDAYNCMLITTATDS